MVQRAIELKDLPTIKKHKRLLPWAGHRSEQSGLLKVSKDAAVLLEAITQTWGTHSFDEIYGTVAE